MESNDSNPKEKSARSGLGMKAGIVIVLALAVGATFYMKNQNRATDSSPNLNPTAAWAATGAKSEEATAAAPVAGHPTASEAKTGLPRLVDLGATKCIPCKMMAPILEELKKTYAGKLDVVFIDVWEKPDEAKRFNINLIPTQIFYDASGKERFRHEGFFSKEDILAKWKEFGVEL